MKTTAVHCKREPFDVYIGRGSIWGNPYRIGPDGDRAQVITDYLAYLLASDDLWALLHTLKGKRLGCFCKPQACHGDVLAMLVEEYC